MPIADTSSVSAAPRAAAAGETCVFSTTTCGQSVTLLSPLTRRAGTCLGSDPGHARTRQAVAELLEILLGPRRIAAQVVARGEELAPHAGVAAATDDLARRLAGPRRLVDG